jgi:enterochelin esterase-like enzyme
LPGAVPQPWVNKTVGTPAGTIERRTIMSIILGTERPIAVYTPPGYRPEATPTPLVVLFDGESYLSDAQAVPTTMDNLIAASKIPPTTVVFVLNTGNGAQRLADLLDNERFGDFVAKELVPWMRTNYNVTSDVARTVAGGFSAGGIGAAFVALKHSDVVGNVLSQSGAFWWEQRMRLDGPDDPDFDDVPEANTIATLYAESRKLPLRFYLDAGTLEIDPGPFGILTQNRHLRDVLLAKGYTVYFQQFVGGHDGLSWRGTVADGLIALLAEH